jgi:tetratricopeptide (TPR) repeat protein
MAAEGVFEGLLGGEDAEARDEPERRAELDGQGLAATLAMDQARADPLVARKAAEFLERQSRLLEMQTAHATAEHPLRMSHLRNQSREGRLRRIGQRFRIGLQVFTALIFTAIGLGLAVMIYDAFNSRAVIVQSFDAPPALAARGLTGKVVAGGVLDALTRLQAATRSSVIKRNLSNAWTSDIKVAVPETGVSIEDVDRLLKARFGHDIHIDGDLIQTETGGLALSVRGDGVLPRTFVGGAGDLVKLTTQGAEYIYGQSQPGLYATYLYNAGRYAEAAAFARSAFPIARGEDRAEVLNAWANSLTATGGSAREGLTLYSEAVKIKPDFWNARSNIINSQLVLQDEEGAWRSGEAMRRAAGGRPGRAPEFNYENSDFITWNLLAWRAATIADSEAHAGIGSNATSNSPAIADIDARLHDPVDAEWRLETTQADPNDPTIAAMAHFVRGRLAAEAGDAQKAAAEMEAFGVAFTNPVVSTNYAGYNCWIAPAEEAAGHPDKADAALTAGGRYVDCYRFRGDILDHRGDWARAQKAYASSVAIAPDLPAGYYSWGAALARHGELAGAGAKLAAAHLRGPHWADPLKAWGDVLARQGRWKDALANYDAALKDAPAWTDLHVARDAAARRAT